MTQAELPGLKAKLLDKGMPEKEARKVLAYVSGALADEAEKAPNKRPISNNSIDTIYRLAAKFFDMGLTIDGINVVITGKNMAMPTFHGYKNRVLQVYPETEFDYGLVREGDTFRLSKSSAGVHYEHDVADPFGTGSIIGAYVVFKNKRGQYIETLNKKDFDSMKGASRQSYLWETWDSEFWLKSVIKRACKRNFNDIVAEIDKVDNDEYGIIDQDTADRSEIDKAIESVANAKDADELTDIVTNLPAEIQKKVTTQAQDKFRELTDGTEA